MSRPRTRGRSNPTIESLIYVGGQHGRHANASGLQADLLEDRDLGRPGDLRVAWTDNIGY